MTAAYLVAALLLLLANGLFVGAEFALIAARRSEIERLADAGDRRARIAARSLSELSLMLAGAQLGITMASLGLGFVAEPGVAKLLEAGLGSIGGLSEEATHSISLLLSLTIVVYLHMVVGEMVPKNIAIAEPERSALWFIGPFRLFVVVFRPAIHLLNAIANGLLRAVRVEPKDELVTVHTADEIGVMITDAAREGVIKSFEHRLLSGAIAFKSRDAASVMVPRTEMVAIPATATPEDIEALVLETGHSRLPVYGSDLDDIRGFFHAKDLLQLDARSRGEPIPPDLVRQLLVVPESRPLHPLLLDMRRGRHHFALVVDEHGGTAGVVALEDVLEELVGEIEDESDARARGLTQLADGRWLVPGNMRLDELERALDIELPQGEYETVAGFVLDRIGSIPKRGDCVTHGLWKVCVHTMRRRRVERLTVVRVDRLKAGSGDG